MKLDKIQQKMLDENLYFSSKDIAELFNMSTQHFNKKLCQFGIIEKVENDFTPLGGSTVWHPTKYWEQYAVCSYDVFATIYWEKKFIYVVDQLIQEDKRERLLKIKQFKIIQKYNPMKDNIHTGIRKDFEVKTFKEAIQDKESFSYPDYSYDKAINNLLDFMVHIYSSKEIEKGVFVSPSKKMAEDYAGNGKIYDKTVYLDEIAWINADEGIYTGKIVIKDEEL